MNRSAGGPSASGPEKVALSGPEEKGPLPIDLPFVPEAEVFFDELLDRMDRSGGIPRLLFLADGDEGREAGLAAVLIARRAAARGLDVLLVDAAFHAPVLGKPFPYQPEEGLADMVLWGASLSAAIHKTKDARIRVVNIGSPPPDPSTFWNSDEAGEALRAMATEAELTILAGPLRDEAGEESPLSGKCDRVLFVRREGEEGPGPSGEGAIEILLEEEPPREESPGKKSPAGTVERAEGTRIPVGRTIGLFAVLCVVIGFVLSYFYLNRGGGGTEQVRVAERPAAGAPGEESSERPVSGDPAGEGKTAAVPDENRAEDAESGGEEAVPEETGSDDAGEEGNGSGEAPATGPSERRDPSPAEERNAPPPAEARSAPPPAEEERSAPAPAERTAAAQPPAGSPFYGVHVESFPTREDADLAVDRFLKGGETVTIVEKAIAGKGTWYRIVLGRFADAAGARAHAEEAKERFDLDYVLVVRVKE